MVIVHKGFNKFVVVGNISLRSQAGYGNSDSWSIFLNIRNSHKITMGSSEQRAIQLAISVV